MTTSDPSTPDDKPSSPGTKERAEQPRSDKPESTRQKPVRVDPTRYGDWEKNGRCIDF